MRSGAGTRTAIALALVLATAATLPVASAAANSYAPHRGKSFFGISDTGEIEHYRKFQNDVLHHPAVLQTFHQWGTHPWQALERWAKTDTRGMLSVSTTDSYSGAEVRTPKRIAKGYGDEYPLLLNRRFAHERETVYIRFLPEMNGHWNPYCAFNVDGSGRGRDHKTRWFRAAWRRFTIIVRGGKRARINRRLRRLGMPPILRTYDKRVYRDHRVGERLARPKVALMWVPQSRGSPDLRANRPRAYWPGRRFVDWIGVDIYAKFPNFEGMQKIYRNFPRKPFLVGEWSSWDHDSPGFVRELFRWARRHRRTKLLAYYQGFAGSNPHRIWHYPRARRRLRRELGRPRYDPYAADSRRESRETPDDTGGTEG
jgi:hypothetical protein